MTQPPSHSPLPELPMYAYYYAFDPTGVRSVDEILSSVAFAGKAFHHTDQWTDECSFLDGKSCRDNIQEAAVRAASLHDELVGALEEAHGELLMLWTEWAINRAIKSGAQPSEWRQFLPEMHQRITAALAKAKGPQ
jgi:hypothetical protein